FQGAAPVLVCHSEKCGHRTRPCRADVEVVRLSRGVSPIRATVQVPIPTGAVRTPDINLSASGPVCVPTDVPRSNVDFRYCASGSSASSIVRPRAQSLTACLRRRSARRADYAIARLMVQATSLLVTNMCASPPLGFTMYLLLSRL